jgi:hypothetical protein
MWETRRARSLTLRLCTLTLVDEFDLPSGK